MADSAAGAVTTSVATDQDLVQFLGTANRAEIEAAQVALNKASTSDVRAFAQRMIDEHSRATQRLTELSGRSGWMMPDTMSMMNVDGRDTGTAAGSGGAMNAVATLRAQHRSMMQQLQAATGAEFDRSYISSQVTAHQQVLNMLRQFGTEIQSSELRTQVNETQAMVEEHLRQAQDLQQRVST